MVEKLIIRRKGQRYGFIRLRKTKARRVLKSGPHLSISESVTGLPYLTHK